MLKLQELNAAISIRDQLMDESKEPVVLVNLFHVAPEQTDALVSAWTDDARYRKTQPGFISAQLHRGIAGSSTFLNYAVWESVSAFRAAFANPVFQAKLADYPRWHNGLPASVSQAGGGRRVCRLSFKKIYRAGLGRVANSGRVFSRFALVH